MQLNVVPVFLFVLLSTLLAFGMVLLAWAVGPSKPSAVKEMPYESGMDPIHDTRRRFDVRFHLLAITFLLFDVELLFLYPWAVATRNASGVDMAVADGLISGRSLVFAGALAFLAVLVLGFIYDWRKGIFQWR